MSALKLGIVGSLALLAAAFMAGSPRDTGQPRQAEAGPVAMQGLNGALCTTLGIAFAGLESVKAITYCGNIDEQNATDEGIQSFVRCLRGRDYDRDGKINCTQANDPDAPLYEPGTQQITPDDFATLDRDQNQIHPGIKFIVMAFVDDDAPVRFTADFGVDVGQFLGTNSSLEGSDYYCESYSAGTEGDPDCDGNPATEGDGVVVTQVALANDAEPGVYTVTAIQEGVGFPMEFTVVGVPKRVELVPLFGKTVISTGGTAPTSSLLEDEDDNGFADKFDPPLPTACDFAATASAVLGANSDPEKVIIVAKAFDKDDNEVVGALLVWNFPFTSTSSLAVLSDIAGVALPQTPTLDTGPLGVAFPQFLCGKDEPGIFKVTAALDVTLDPLAKGGASETIDITVVGPGENIVLTASPAVVNCDGTASATVSAMVTTAEGANAANGTDVNWSVQTLGTANPLVSNTGDGIATTVVTPLNGATSGVPVVARVGDNEASILVNCAPGTGTIPPSDVPPAGGAGAGGGRPTITGPDTGSGGDLDGAGPLSAWPAIALFVAAMALVGARYAIRDR